MGHTKTITWSVDSSCEVYSGNVRTYYCIYSSTGVETCTTIDSSEPSTDVSHDWYLAGSMAAWSSYKIKLAYTGDYDIYAYSEFFDVSTTTCLTVTSPVSADTAQAESVRNSKRLSPRSPHVRNAMRRASASQMEI